MTLIIKGGRVIDPLNGTDEIRDIYIEDNKIIQSPKTKKTNGVEVIDARGLIVAPGLIDMHCHLREPGFEYK